MITKSGRACLVSTLNMLHFYRVYYFFNFYVKDQDLWRKNYRSKNWHPSYCWQGDCLHKFWFFSVISAPLCFPVWSAYRIDRPDAW